MRYLKSLTLATVCLVVGFGSGAVINSKALALYGGWNVNQACFQATHANMKDKLWAENLQQTFVHFQNTWGGFHTQLVTTHKLSPMEINNMAFTVAHYMCSH